jgi:hypothetical protein
MSGKKLKEESVKLNAGLLPWIQDWEARSDALRLGVACTKSCSTFVPSELRPALTSQQLRRLLKTRDVQCRCGSRVLRRVIQITVCVVLISEQNQDCC